MDHAAQKSTSGALVLASMAAALPSCDWLCCCRRRHRPPHCVPAFLVCSGTTLETEEGQSDEDSMRGLTVGMLALVLRPSCVAVAAKH